MERSEIRDRPMAVQSTYPGGNAAPGLRCAPSRLRAFA